MAKALKKHMLAIFPTFAKFIPKEWKKPVNPYDGRYLEMTEAYTKRHDTFNSHGKREGSFFFKIKCNLIFLNGIPLIRLE